MDLDTVAALRGPQGRVLLETATAHDDASHALAAAGDAAAVDPLRAATALRRAHPDVHPSLAAAVLTQVRLRRRARTRLGDGLVAQLLLTEDGLEQATRTVVADLRARRYADHGATHVADLGCGLGLDSLAFARAGLRVTAIERDAVTAALAASNVEALGLAGTVTVVVGDLTDPAVLDALPSSVDAAYLDPARRDDAAQRDGRSARVRDPGSWSPPWSWVEQVASRIPRTAAKVAPGVPHAMTPDGGCATWTSVDGQLVEAELAWPGLCDRATRRRAVAVRDGVSSTMSTAEDLVAEGPPPTGAIGRWIEEPDDAVIRAGLVAGLARHHLGRLLDPRVAYVTGDACDPPPGALARRFRVDRALPFDLDDLRAALLGDGVGSVVIKKRAISADPDEVRRRLALPRSARSAVVILTRLGEDPWAFVCDVG